MAVTRRKLGDEIEDGLVRMTEQEAVKYQMEVISNWTPALEVWPFKVSTSILAAMGGLSGLFINKYYRRKLQLGNNARISTYIPIVVFPALLSGLLHQQFVLFDVAIRRTQCPVCMQMRSAALQIFTSSIYPMVLAPLSCFTFATRLHTYNLPYITSLESARPVLKVWRKLTKPIVTPVLVMTAFQGIVATSLVLAQQNTVLTMEQKLRKSQTEFDDQ